MNNNNDNNLAKTEIRVRLHIVDFNFEPSLITEKLRIDPTKTWNRGDPRFKPEIAVEHARRGSTFAHYSNNGWVLKSDLSEDETAEEHIAHIFNILAPSWESIKEISSQCYIELSITVRMFGGDRPPLAFNAAVVKKLAEINGHIDVDLYNF